MEELVKKWILNSGEDHNVEIVLYGMQVIVDGMISIFALLLLGIILKKVGPTFIFILFPVCFPGVWADIMHLQEEGVHLLHYGCI